MAKIFETARLIARQWVPQEDAFQAFEMYGDPVVTRFISSQVEPNIETTRARLHRYAALNNGIGSLALVEKESARVVVPEKVGETRRARVEARQEFEVEIIDEVEGAWIRIPSAVVESDPRWRMLTRNSVLKAKWEGLALKLLPVGKQNNEQNSAIEKASASGGDCCTRCEHFNRKTSQCRCCTVLYVS